MLQPAPLLALGRLCRSCCAAAAPLLQQYTSSGSCAHALSTDAAQAYSSADAWRSAPAEAETVEEAYAAGTADAYAMYDDDVGSIGYEDIDTVDFGFQEVPREAKAAHVKQVFSSVASSYDTMNDVMSGGLHRLWKDRLVEALLPFPGMQHLDVAGGTGDVAFRVLRQIRDAEQAAWLRDQQQQQGPQPPQQQSLHGQARRGHVTVCDINPQMLEVGRSRAVATGLAGDGRLTWVEGNAERLPFGDGAMDAYTIAFGIRNVTDRGAALAEAHRVLRRGGRFLCLEFSQVTQPVLRQLYDTYSLNVIPKLGGVIASDEASYQYLVESIRRFPDQDTFATMIQDAGFKAVEYENLTGGIVAMHSGFKL